MTYKEKHLRHAFGAMALSALMLVPTGCADNQKKDDKEIHPQGLLDNRPLKTIDKFNTEVVLFHVNIPLYEKNGNAMADRFVLTRGLEKSDYKPTSKKTYIRKAYINGSADACYVMTDDKNAIYTDKGFVGLFVDDSDNNKVVVVADCNIPDFIKGHVNRYMAESKTTVAAATARLVEKIGNNSARADTLNQTAVKTDSIYTDFMTALPDTLANEKTVADSAKVDTLFNHQKIRE